MSLHKFAEQVAAQGRGDDSLLVHMTPDEVQRLQAFAEANGRTMTINPETGLPEAGFLSDLFKAVAPIALGAFLGPAGAAIGGGFMSASMAGLAVGGITTLATGSLSRGLMAGLGAYGGAGLGESLMNAGTGALSQSAGAGLVGDEAIQQAVGAKLAAATPMETLTAGFNSATATPTAMGTFAKQNLGNIGYAASPILAGAMVPTTTKADTTKSDNYIRQFDFNINPDTGKPDPLYGVRSMAPVKANEFGNKTFQGQRDLFRQQNPNPYELGVGSLNQPPQQQQQQQQQQQMGMAGGGIVALANGGVPGYAAGGVSDADILGWFNANPGANDALIAQTMQQANVTPDQVARATGTDYANVNERYLAATAPTSAGIASLTNTVADTGGGGTATGTNYQTVDDLYQNVLGRGVESEGAANYWQNLFGPTIDANEVAQFQTAAQAELAGRSAAPTGGLNALTATTPFTNQYTFANINDYIANNNLDAAGIAAAAKQFNVDPAQITAAQNAQSVVSNVFRNVLGRDPDPNGLDYWTNEIMSGRSTGQDMLDTFIKNAKANNEIIVNPNIKLDDAVKEFGGYKSSNARDIADEWVRNTLGREVTASDRQQQWYKDAVNDAVMNTYGKAQDIYGGFKTYAQGEATATTAKAINDAKASLAARGLTEADVVKQTGKTIAQLVAGGTNLGLDLYQASQLKAPGAATKFDFSTIQKAKAVVPNTFGGGPVARTDTNPYGNATNPGDITRNPDGTITVTPNIPYRPYGGFTGIQEIKDAYTRGGGSLGYTSRAPKTMDEFNQLYNKQTGDSLAAYNYLMGKGANPVKSGAPKIAEPYNEYVLGKKIAGLKPATVSGNTLTVGGVSYDLTDPTRPPPADTKGTWQWNELNKRWIKISADGTVISDGGGDGAAAGGGGDSGGGGGGGNAAGAASAAGGGSSAPGTGNASTSAAADSAATSAASVGVGDADASGGRRGGRVVGYAMGGGLGSLGSYSDGGRLLRGPGDGVSDSIPATIGRKNQPARLADGEFVIPARIVSELGNGSTDAGAKKLYAMMDRVQKARGKTTGKNKVAANSRSDKYLPA